MPIEIRTEDIKDYLDYYNNPKKYKIPGRDTRKYNVADNFFTNIEHARGSLVKLVNNITFPQPNLALEQDVYAEFIVTGHAKVRKAPGQDEDVKMLVGQSAMMLERGEEGTAVALMQSTNADPNTIAIVSDLPRAIHHALLKYKPKLEEELDLRANSIQEEMQKNKGEVSRETHLNLVELALENGIIPTPLLRSHYHGPRDLHPERWEQFNINGFLNTPLGRDLYTEKNETEVRELLEKLRELARTGKAPFQLIEENDKPLTENLPLYTFRVTYLAELFSPPRGRFYSRVNGKRINFVGHSSNLDVLYSYFRHFESGRVVLEKADKAKTRGKELVIKADKEYRYLNDPALLDPLRKDANDRVNELRERSIDVLIKKGEGILEIPLLGFREKKEKSGVMEEYESYPETLESTLTSPYPIVIFGHGGQGKTILSTEIAKRFLEGKFGKTYENYMPVFLDCEAVGKAARSNKDSYGDARMESIITKQIDELKLPKVLLEEYKFVFILDDYQKLSSDYTKEIEAVITKLRREGNLVILLSRLEKIDVHPPHNLGYKTMQIDLNSIAKQTDEFIEGRIPSKDVGRFKEYLSQYDTSITGNYMTKLFLTMIFPTGNGKSTGVTDYIIDPLIQTAIKEGKPLTQTKLYDAQTDYVSAQDILRIHPALSLSEVRERIVELKNELAEKAFNDVFGKDGNARK